MSKWWASWDPVLESELNVLLEQKRKLVRLDRIFGAGFRRSRKQLVKLFPPHIVRSFPMKRLLDTHNHDLILEAIYVSAKKKLDFFETGKRRLVERLNRHENKIRLQRDAILVKVLRDTAVGQRKNLSHIRTYFYSSKHEAARSFFDECVAAWCASQCDAPVVAPYALNSGHAD